MKPVRKLRSKQLEVSPGSMSANILKMSSTGTTSTSMGVTAAKEGERC